MFTLGPVDIFNTFGTRRGMKTILVEMLVGARATARGIRD
jgi:hypothetical protein